MSDEEPLNKITQRLKSDTGDNFSSSVVDAFACLGFDVEKIEETQAESDIIAKAPLAERPYFLIIECSAVREGEQVGYQKLGQIRGNSPKYVAKYGKDFLSSYKVVVGRPIFSRDAIDLARPDVTLINVDNLTKLLSNHVQFYFSQDELESIFANYGEVTEQQINNLVQPFMRKLRLYALIYMSLLKEPISKPIERKKGWTSVQQLIGSVQKMGWFFKIRDIAEEEVIDAVRDLSNPIVNAVERINDDKVRLASIPLEVIVKRMHHLGKIFNELIVDFQKTALGKEPRTITLTWTPKP